MNHQALVYPCLGVCEWNCVQAFAACAVSIPIPGYYQTVMRARQPQQPNFVDNAHRTLGDAPRPPSGYDSGDFESCSTSSCNDCLSSKTAGRSPAHASSPLVLQQPAIMGLTAAYVLTAVHAVPPREKCLDGVAHFCCADSSEAIDNHAGPSLLWQLTCILACPHLLSYLTADGPPSIMIGAFLCNNEAWLVALETPSKSRTDALSPAAYLFTFRQVHPLTLSACHCCRIVELAHWPCRCSLTLLPYDRQHAVGIA